MATSIIALILLGGLFLLSSYHLGRALRWALQLPGWLFRRCVDGYHYLARRREEVRQMRVETALREEQLKNEILRDLFEKREKKP